MDVISSSEPQIPAQISSQDAPNVSPRDAKEAANLADLPIELVVKIIECLDASGSRAVVRLSSLNIFHRLSLSHFAEPGVLKDMIEIAMADPRTSIFDHVRILDAGLHAKPDATKMLLKKCTNLKAFAFEAMSSVRI